MSIRIAQAVALRRTTFRSVYWPPALVALVVAGAVVIGQHETFNAVGSAMVTLRVTAVLLALGAVFALDDAAAVTVASVPTPLWWRRMLRYAVVAVFVLPMWTVVLAYAQSRHPDLPWPRLTLEFAVLVTLGLAVAGAAARWFDVTDPGMSAALTVLGFTLVTANLPPRFAFYATPESAQWAPSVLRWSLVLVVVLTVLMSTAGDPARTSLRRSGARLLSVTTLGGLAAILAGVMMVTHGVVKATGGPDLDFLPFALALLAGGLWGLHRRLRGGGGRWGEVGRVLSLATLWMVAVEIVSLLLLGLADAVPVLTDSVLTVAWPVHALTLGLTFLAIVVTLPVLGVAALRAEALAPRWRSVPLAVGVLWIVLFMAGEVLGDVISPDKELGFGFVPMGVAWIVLGVVIAE